MAKKCSLSIKFVNQYLHIFVRYFFTVFEILIHLVFMENRYVLVNFPFFLYFLSIIEFFTLHQSIYIFFVIMFNILTMFWIILSKIIFLFLLIFYFFIYFKHSRIFFSSSIYCNIFCDHVAYFSEFIALLYQKLF